MNQRRVNSRQGLELLQSCCRHNLREHIHHILRMHPRFSCASVVITGWLGWKGRNQQLPAAGGSPEGLCWSRGLC